MGERVLMGLIANVHGLDGAVKIKSFTERPADILAYGPLCDEAGKRQFALSLIGQPKNDMLLARIEGITERTQAERLKGQKLFIPRHQLPDPKTDEFYLSDVLGLSVREEETGRVIGKAQALENYGAGNVLTILLTEGQELSLPFTRAFVPVIDLENAIIGIHRPAEIEAEEESEEGNV